MSSSDEVAWLRAVRREVARTMCSIGGDWRDDGTSVTSPGVLAIRVERRHEADQHHVDIGFCLDGARADAIIWDCVSGFGDEIDAAARFAARVWGQTTAATILEMIVHDGTLASHSHGDPTLGLAGWHSIHGPVLGYGQDDATALQRWCLDHPIVPLIGASLAPELEPGVVHGVKLLVASVGDEAIAEVRIDGARHDACSDALLELPWPKTGHRIARSFVLFVHSLDVT